MEYLTQQNKLNAGEDVDPDDRITAEGKRVVILGGGDTGADCLGTAHRQGAEIIRQFELLAEPPHTRTFNNPWPQWPVILRSSGAHDEGGIRDYNISTTHFTGRSGHVEKLHAVRVEWKPDESGRVSMQPLAGSEFAVDADLVLLAMGFLHPEHVGMLEELRVEFDGRGNVKLDDRRMTNVSGVFAAGDMARGQSLVVWALAEGRETAYFVDAHLMGASELPRPYLQPAP
jgi:glutamate synthase (NADPH/NADH) small chain